MKNIYDLRRNVHGVLLLDKPYGVSSNQALQQVKRIYHARKAGHTGSLDPIATGMLPICLGESTKFAQYLLNSDKHYRVIARLGQKTDTSDSSGILLSERPVMFTTKVLKEALDSFRGETQQTPSMYSAIKYKGRKLYEYARSGVHVPCKSRKIVVNMLQCIRCEGNEIELDLRVSKGTYIRTIIDDLGEKLGCGAHVSYLRRLQVSHYLMTQMITMQSLQKIINHAKDIGLASQNFLDILLMPMDSPVSNYPLINLSSIMAQHLKNGCSVSLLNSPANGLVRVTEGLESNFLGIGEIINNSLLVPRRLVSKYFLDSTFKINRKAEVLH
ncbi:tRNA pseudouridine(55) synthase TruB [Candidatus Erwinia haradaeae]|uniref:tRNA pseudouridine synthase B n=1 Tax=Candidatus Erwinia haradaeae TaxID=1922217 RepID=A0A451DIC0_9GAMM|nr:tRNA pseudouridine(55) synthase TruB [Candidatus Erwinia haradaeae]VFP86403.1 tRNA pseudouridine synthase B [Candidatus Erwinia haradaeae]